VHLTWQGFLDWAGGLPSLVVLLEGIRDLPPSDRPALFDLARRLALALPERAVFRSGNAPGADEAFAEGIAAVAPARLELVVPYRGHRMNYILETSRVHALDDLDRAAEERAAFVTGDVSPKTRGMILRRRGSPALQKKASYLIRDTIKVLGDGRDLAPATVGIFYTREQDPEAGGTGHTVRVCRTAGVPVFTQRDWMPWVSSS
jgi:hypothetical protein